MKSRMTTRPFAVLLSGPQEWLTEHLTGQEANFCDVCCRARLKDGNGFDAISRLVTHWDDLSDKQKITYANAAHTTRLLESIQK